MLRHGSIPPECRGLIVNGDGNLLICERAGVQGAWQFPQGGVDTGETMEEALYREVREEIGIGRKHYEILDRRDGYRYLYPPDVRAKKLKKHGNHGQEQTYFLCRLKPSAPPVDVNQTPQEFGPTAGSTRRNSTSNGFRHSSGRFTGASLPIFLGSGSNPSKKSEFLRDHVMARHRIRAILRSCKG